MTPRFFFLSLFRVMACRWLWGEGWPGRSGEGPRACPEDQDGLVNYKEFLRPVEDAQLWDTPNRHWPP